MGEDQAGRALVRIEVERRDGACSHCTSTVRAVEIQPSACGAHHRRFGAGTQRELHAVLRTGRSVAADASAHRYTRRQRRVDAGSAAPRSPVRSSSRSRTPPDASDRAASARRTLVLQLHFAQPSHAPRRCGAPGRAHRRDGVRPVSASVREISTGGASHHDRLAGMMSASDAASRGAADGRGRTPPRTVRARHPRWARQRTIPPGAATATLAAHSASAGLGEAAQQRQHRRDRTHRALPQTARIRSAPTPCPTNQCSSPRQRWRQSASRSS